MVDNYKIEAVQFNRRKADKVESFDVVDVKTKTTLGTVRFENAVNDFYFLPEAGKQVTNIHLEEIHEFLGELYDEHLMSFEDDDDELQVLDEMFAGEEDFI